MTNNAKQKNGNRPGLTLIELLVVLTILIALGGIVVSSLPGLLGRTQSATAAANVPEIDSAIRRKLLVTNGTIGDRFDSLITGATGEVASYVGGASYFQATTMNEADVNALSRIGITELIPADPGPADATFESHRQPPIPITNDSRVCSVSDAFSADMMQRLWNIDPIENARYLVFGLGSRSSLVGGSEDALFSESPVHFSDEASTGPKKMYSRYLIVVELKPDIENQSRARYVGIAIPSKSGLRGISEELKDVY